MVASHESYLHKSSRVSRAEAFIVVDHATVPLKNGSSHCRRSSRNAVAFDFPVVHAQPIPNLDRFFAKPDLCVFISLL